MTYLRLKKRKEIQKILREGKRVYAATLCAVYLPAAKTGMAVCVGKKYGKSVQRNRIKRLLREAFRAQTISVPVGVLLIPKAAETYSYAAFSRDLKHILSKEKL